MEHATELLAAIHCTTIGLSHLSQPKGWVEFFIWLRGKGAAGAFVNGFLSLGVGAFIVAFHNVWTGIPVALTILGWLQVLKGFVCFVAPQKAERSFARVSFERAWEFQVGGGIMLLLGVALWFVILTR